MRSYRQLPAKKDLLRLILSCVILVCLIYPYNNDKSFFTLCSDEKTNLFHAYIKPQKNQKKKLKKNCLLLSYTKFSRSTYQLSFFLSCIYPHLCSIHALHREKAKIVYATEFLSIGKHKYIRLVNSTWSTSRLHPPTALYNIHNKTAIRSFKKNCRSVFLQFLGRRARNGGRDA